jgi:3-methyladenine DNA glycosylase AlkD
MSAVQILQELEALGSASYARILQNHGVKEPLFGVKISELKRILKPHRGDQSLADELYASRNYDAQYLAGLMADPRQMSKADLKRWLKTANSVTTCGTTVAALAGESAHAAALGREWIKSKQVDVAQTGWTTLTAWVSVTPDEDLDLPWLKELLEQAETSLQDQPDRVRYAMNNFVIAVGCFVAPLTKAALAAAKKIGVVECDMGKTACQVPAATEYIRKVQDRGTIGKKRASARC